MAEVQLLADASVTKDVTQQTEIVEKKTKRLGKYSNPICGRSFF